MNILSIDVGGTHVKVLVSDQGEPRKSESGPSLTPGEMVDKVMALTAGWSYSTVSIGYPGLAVHGRIAAEPSSLGRGWVVGGFRLWQNTDAAPENADKPGRGSKGIET